MDGHELSGIVVVDKPAGLSSAQVVARVKKLFGARKAGHTGTLDPFATGILVCCINRATRLARFFLKGDKTYEAVLRLGAQTDTQDATGVVTDRQPVEGISTERVVRVASRFTGTISQVPPVYSALKHEGTPLYKLARRGQAVEKPARSVRIDRLEILDVRLPDVRFAVSCSAGTYIRTLCADMGAAMGCGGHLKTLCRTASCGFGLADALGLDRLKEWEEAGSLKKAVIGMRDALHFSPEVVAEKPLVQSIRNGVKLPLGAFPDRPTTSPEGFIKVVDRSGRLLAVLEASPGSDSYIYCCVFSE